MTYKYIQYGCGTSCPDGWLNYDTSPRLRFEQLPGVRKILPLLGKNPLFPERVRLGDIVKGLPVPAESAKAVYCSHVLEHLDRASLEVALRNTIKMLKPGGVFRLVVPDLEWRVRKFIEMIDAGKVDANDWFMRSSHLGEAKPLLGLTGRTVAAFGNSKHRWMWHQDSMAKMLLQAGFVAVRRCGFGDAEDNMFALVESKERFEDTGYFELAMEAVRPM
jgi:SAM-dependent methyltransferase